MGGTTMAARAAKGAVIAVTLLQMKGADGYMPHHQQIHDVQQDFRNPAICRGVNPLNQRLGSKVAVPMAGSLQAASTIAAGSSANDAGLGSGEACGSEDAECDGDDMDEMTFSVLCWICTFFFWCMVARTIIDAAVYVAGSATALFVVKG
ncbi:expressed unknown protein [Ectocarpus siliculosus]|uniref:Uncharacterized protein n=1 Tax=Ectocarpus siliculosus TaxID=2880 RepID=D7G955_ECTSI|nr:expressed unknown protein [Ectocarpus siliculosus]|eukprot:CBJ28219.1 expressed unknown protein [Ectocarpus siliculosus]